jgi:hypothetical protein
MRREWRFGVRSAASPSTCAIADDARVASDVAGAFVDRAPIDWNTLRDRLHAPADRAWLDSLRALESIRAPLAAQHVELNLVPRPLLIMSGAVLALVIVQMAFGITEIAITGLHQPSRIRPAQALLTLAFSTSAGLLALITSEDRRSLFLLTAFAGAASAFLRASIDGALVADIVVFRGLFPEAFAPAAMWQFAVAFPKVRRFATFDVVARRAAGCAWLLGSMLFVVNAATAYGLTDQPIARALERDHPGNVFWHLFGATVLPAVGAMAVRARRAPLLERTRVAHFAAAIAVGLAPFLVIGLARVMMPSLNDSFTTQSRPGRLWLDVAIIAGLMAAPLLSSVAMIMDRPFERQTALGDRSLLRRLIGAMSGRRRRATEYQVQLHSALERLRTARGPREIEAVLIGELRKGTQTIGVHLLPASAGERLVDHTRRVPALPADAVLASLLRETSGAIDVTARTLKTLLPSAERQWAAAHDVVLVSAIKRSDGEITAVILVGPREDGRGFGRQDRWFVGALASAAAATWEAGEVDAQIPDARSTRSDGDPAYECPRCGVVSEQPRGGCACGVDAALAALPRNLHGRLVVQRRLGAGGMGVVYLATDVRLDRAVALKTLPKLRDGAVPRLTDEARAMAALNHHALATIYGLEIWRRTPVLVVEYFPDGTLADALARGPLPLASVLSVAGVLSSALDYMHARGVLHRDLKPSNIALTPSGAPKLLDFGLAVIADTRFGGLDVDAAGTRAYLPPEALAGAPACPAFDVWALSVVMLEALTGTNPFVANSAATQSADPHRVMRVCRDAFARQPALIAFFARALAIDPQSRYSSAAVFQAALADLASATATRDRGAE